MQKKVKRLKKKEKKTHAITDFDVASPYRIFKGSILANLLKQKCALLCVDWTIQVKTLKLSSLTLNRNLLWTQSNKTAAD